MIKDMNHIVSHKKAHPQSEWIEKLISFTAEKREKLYARWYQKPAGRSWCQTLSDLADSVIQELQEIVWQNAPRVPQIAIVATGGYGRKELAPKSDIDITFIPLEDEDPVTENAVRKLFRAIIHVFSKLDWSVGYAYRLPEDCPALDPVTRSGLLDARLVGGSEKAFRQFMKVFQKTFPTAEFLIYKLEEREQALTKFGDTPRMVEFHLREGAGGLREAQTAKNLTSLLGFSLPSLNEKDYDTLLKIRNGLHIITGRKQDILVRTRLGELARALSTTPQELSATLIASAERIHSAWIQARQKALLSRFPLAPFVRAENGACNISERASIADCAIGVYRASKLGLSIPHVTPGTKTKARSQGNIPRVVECLTSNEKALRALDESGLLDALIPEFAKTKTLLPNDPAHIYSVGEHSLRVVSALDQLRKNPQHESICSTISNWRPLYLAALLHDVGKIIPGKPHSKTGAQIAEKVCKRLGIHGEEKQTVVWLVKEHLTLPHIARTHDLSIPQTAYSVAKLCERQDKMAMLYLLTIADTSSVNPEALTPQMASALRQLYERASSALGKEKPPQDLALFRNEALRRLQTHTTKSIEDVEEFINTMPTHYLLATPWEQFALHADYVRQAKNGETTVVFQHRRDAHLTDITICTKDLPEPGLLSQILGIIYALDITIHEARAASTREPQPIALDVISTSYQGNCLPENLCRVLSNELKNRLGNPQAVDAWLRQKGKDPTRRQEMLTYRFHEGNPAILDIETPLGRGMPYRVAKMLASLGWNVEVARIGQWAGKAVARFYVSSSRNKSLTRKEVQKSFKNL